MEKNQSVKPFVKLLTNAVKHIACVMLFSMVAGCMSFGVFNHNHHKQPVKVVVFSGLESYDNPLGTGPPMGPSKSYQEPRFIVLQGVAGRHVTWTFRGAGSAEFSHLDFMQEVSEDTVSFVRGAFTLNADESKTLKLGPGPHPDVYEFRIIINGDPINFPVKVIP